MLSIMDHSQLRDGYNEENFNAAGWPMHHQGYHSPNLVSPTQEYPGFNFNSQVPIHNIYAPPIPPHLTHGHFAGPWPSQIAGTPHGVPPQMATSQTMTHFGAPPPPSPLITTPTPPAPQPQSTSRRTLTDHDRRRMCQYHEDNPTVKQTEIGAMFGVERSTVSKVLRNKEKYLAQEDGSKSPIRRAKGKFPDIERALTNWAAKHQQKGMQLTDQAIRDKARFFAASVGNPEASAKVNSASWLEKFKQKNQISLGKGKKAASSSNTDLSQLSGSPTPSGISPVSPAGLEPSPLADSPRDRKKEIRTDSPSVPGSRLVHSKSATSLTSGYSDSTSSFSTGPPPMPAIYEAQLATMSEAMQQHQQHGQNHMPPPATTAESIRPRSQTFPMLGIETSHPGMGNNYTDCQIEDIMSHSALDTPQDEFPGRSLSVTSLSSTEMSQMQHSHPPSMLGTPGMEHSPLVMTSGANALHPASASSSNLASPIGPPTLDDGRRGLEMALGFLHTLPTGVVDPQEYMVLGKLMEKLKTLTPSGGEMPGGMHSINVKGELDRKRSMHSL